MIATARNSRPFANAMVQTVAISETASGSGGARRNARPAAAQACSPRTAASSVRANTPISSGSMPSARRADSQAATRATSSDASAASRISGGGPPKTETTARRSSSRPSPSAMMPGRRRSARERNLVRGSVVHLQDAGAAADVDAKGAPGEGLAKDALADVAGEEQTGATGGEGGEEAELGDAQVLGFVDDGGVERRGAANIPRQARPDGAPGGQASGLEVGAGGGHDRP